MLYGLIAWNDGGEVVATLDHLVRVEDGTVIGLVDFAAHERAGGRLRDVWTVSNAVGSGTWLEWLSESAHDFTVELDPNPSPARARIKALVHKKSGHRRERASIEAAIAERVNEKKLEAKKKGDERRSMLRRRGVKEHIIEQLGDPIPQAADLRDLLGGPGRPLLLDENGRTKARVKRERPNLPYVSGGTRRNQQR